MKAVSPLSKIDLLKLWLRLSTVIFLIPSQGMAQIVTTVTSLEDAGAGTLREAVDNAVADEQIILDPGAAGNISLETALDVTTSLIIDNSAVSSPNEVGIVAPETGNVIDIDDGVALTLRDVNLFGRDTDVADILLEGTGSILIFDLTRELDAMELEITGTGSVEKTGSFDLVFDDALLNTFTGGLTIRNGGVRGNVANLATGDVTFAPENTSAATRIIFDIPQGLTQVMPTGRLFINNAVGGIAPIFEKDGVGTLGLTSGVSIGAGIDINIVAGTLIGQPLQLNDNTVSIQSAGALELGTAGVDATYTGVINGGGSLVVDFVGDTLTLSGDLTGSAASATDGFSGGAVVESGTLFIDPATPTTEVIAFDVDVQNAGSVLRLAEGIQFSGNLSGLGKLETGVAAGTGEVVLTGTSTLSGGIEILGGTLRGNTNNLLGTIDIASGSTLIFSQDFDGRFSGTLQDLGAPVSLQKTGTGVLRLGASQNLMADFDIAAGGLLFENGVDFDLNGGQIRIGDAGGSVASLSALYDPAATPTANTVEIGGDLVLNDGAVLSVDLDDGTTTASATPNNTGYQVTGSITLGNSAVPAERPELVVRLQPGFYALGTADTYTILSGDLSGPQGGFDIRQDYLFFDLFGGLIGSTDYVVLVSPDPTASFASQATTSNQAGVAAALDEIRTTPTSDPGLQNLIANLNVQRVDEAAISLDSLAGDDLAAHVGVRLAGARRTWRGLSERLALVRDESIGHKDVQKKRRQERKRQLRRNALGNQRPSVEAGPGSRKTRPDRKWTGWGDISGGLGDLDSNGESQSVDYTLVGPLVGADRSLNEWIRAGFATAFTHATFELDRSNRSNDSDTVEGVVYATLTGLPLEASAAVRYAHSWIETNRRFSVSSLSDRPTAEFEGNEVGVFLETGWSFGSRKKLEIIPTASLAYTWLDTDDVREDGSTLLRLRSEHDAIHSATTFLGLRLAMEREIDDGFVLRPRLRLGWTREWGDRDRELTSQFAAGASPFRIDGVEAPLDVAEASLGWEVAYGSNANLFLSYDGRFSDDLIENSLSAGLRFNW